MLQLQKFEFKPSMRAVAGKAVSGCSVCFLYKSVHGSPVIQHEKVILNIFK